MHETKADSLFVSRDDASRSLGTSFVTSLISGTKPLIGSGPEAKLHGLKFVQRCELASDSTPQPVSAMSPQDHPKIRALVPNNFFADNCDQHERPSWPGIDS